MEESKLTRKLQKGDRFALNRAITVYTPYLSTVVWHTMGPAATSQDVEEVVSDAFFALWSHREELRPEKGIRSWLAAVARNRAIDRLRTAPPPPLPLDGSEETGSALEEDLERRLFAARLRKAVEALPPPEDQLVLRYYYEEEALKDIAADLGLTVPAAKTRLHRARRKLKDILMKGESADGTDR